MLTSRFPLFPILILVVASGTSACGDQSATGLTPEEQLVVQAESVAGEVLQNSLVITSVLDSARSALSTASGSLDAERIAGQLRARGIAAQAQRSGLAVRVTTKSGGTHLISLFPRSDTAAIRLVAMDSITPLRAPASTPPQPAVSRPSESKALVLAAYQGPFKDNVAGYQMDLAKAGFSVTTHSGVEATVDRFRGDYLRQFGVVIIGGHGTSTDDGKNWILTGEKVNAARSRELAKQLGYVPATASGCDLAGRFFCEDVYAVSDEEMRPTTGSYRGTWFFVNACESAANSSNAKSLSTQLLNAGAGAYSGWETTVLSAVAKYYGSKLVTLAAAGNPLVDATLSVVGLKASWAARAVTGPIARVSTLASLRISYFDDPAYAITRRAVTTVRVTIPTTSTYTDRTLQAYSTALDAVGDTLFGRRATWRSSNSAVATVDSTGLIRAVAAGTTTLSATIEGVTGSVALTVIRSTLAPVACDQTPQPPASAKKIAPTGGASTGGTGNHLLAWNLGTKAQEIVITWNMQTVPDAIVICHRDRRLYDSGTAVSGVGSFKFYYSGSTSSDPSNRAESIYLFTNVQAPTGGTGWSVLVNGTYVAPSYPVPHPPRDDDAPNREDTAQTAAAPR